MTTIVELARVKRGRNKMETARAFAKCKTFHMYRLGEIIDTMRSYERLGWLVYTETEAILYHDYYVPRFKK